MTSPLTAHVSVFQGSTNTSPVETIPLADMLQRIQGDTYQKWVEGLRQLRPTYGEDWYREEKKKSMAFTPAGVFARRANRSLTTPSQRVHFDFDHLVNLGPAQYRLTADHLAQVADIKMRLAADPYILYAFISPGGDGLKVAVGVDGIVDDATYKYAWGTVLAYFQSTYPDLAVANDRQCKDIARLCYVSYDPDLYSNPNAEMFRVSPAQPLAPKEKPPTQRPHTAAAPADEWGRIEEALSWIPADDYEIWLHVGMALHSTRDPRARAAWETWSQTSDKYDSSTLDGKWQGFTTEGGITLRTLFHLAQQYGYNPRGFVPPKLIVKKPAPALDASQGGKEQTPAENTAPPTQMRSKTAPASELAALIAQTWRNTMVFDLGRRAFMQYGEVHEGKEPDGLVPGIFSELDETEVDAAIRLRLEQLVPEGFSGNKLRDVRYLLTTHLHGRMTSGPSALVPFTNGVLDVATGEWLQHNPAHRLTWRLPYAYNAAATCPKTQAWLREACSRHQDQVETIRAYWRAVLCGRTDLQRFLELYGPGGSGKGTLTHIAQGLVGLENVAVTELKYLESNRFETSQLIHKRLIIITDAEQWAGQVSTLKALTGGDSLRVEHKHVRQHLRAVAEGLVIVAANEPVTSADYTSGLARRRLTLPFLHQPQPEARRNLLEIKGDHFEGELVDELPGVVNWVLGMSEADMQRYLLDTTTAAPSLAESHASTLVQTNPLAAWADERLVLDKGASVKVGIARPLAHTNRYEWEDTWLYPNYVAYCHNTGNRPLSSRRFTGLLKDLLVNQLRQKEVCHKTIKTGSHFLGIRFRTFTDEENTSHDDDTYIPQTPFLITGPPSGRATPGEGSPAKGEGLSLPGEGSGEGLHGVDYGSEGSEGSSRAREREGEGREPGMKKAEVVVCTCIERSEDTSHPSLPSLARDNPSLDPSLVRDYPSPDPSPVRPPGLPLNGHRPTPVPPCAVCGGTDRWQDDAVPRCRQCYPPSPHDRKAR